MPLTDNHGRTGVLSPLCTAEKVVAVILSHNAQASLLQVVRAVRSQTHRVDSIVVVDNGSSDGSADKVASLFPQVFVIALPENVGVGAGHNRGWEYALHRLGADYIWSLEHDSVPDADCLRQLMAAYAGHPLHQTLGAICPHQQLGECWQRESPVYLWKGTRFARILVEPSTTLPRYSRSLTFNGTLLPCSVIRKVGLLNCAYFLGQEDFEFALRLKRHGLGLLLVPRAVVHHDILRHSRKIEFFGRLLVLHEQGIKRTYYSVRNAIALQVQLRGQTRTLVRVLVKMPISLLYIMLVQDDKLRRIVVRYLAIRDGLAGRLGPQDYHILRTS